MSENVRKPFHFAAEWAAEERVYKKETDHTVQMLKNYARENFGPECEEYEAECPVCRVWLAVNLFDAVTE